MKSYWVKRREREEKEKSESNDKASNVQEEKDGLD